MIHKRVTIDYLINKLYRDLGLTEDINRDDVIEWSAEALGRIGAFNQFEQKIKTIEIEDGKAKLPCDIYKIRMVTYGNKPLNLVGNSHLQPYFCDDCEIPCCPDCGETFYVNNNYIFTSFDAGDICIEYIGIPVDEEGYPTIPDDEYYIEACKFYVTFMLDWRDWRKGKIADKIKDDSEAKWNFYVQSARGAGNMPGLIELERLKNIMQRLTPLNDEYNNFFANLGNQERKYLQ